MSYEVRRPQFNLSGTLSTGCSAVDTQISSTIFTGLPTDFSSSVYMPLVISNDAQGKAEVVWVTGHSSAASSVTIVRGREGTTAQSFNVGDVVRCAPTPRGTGEATVSTRSALPSDAHYGCRILIQDELQVVERTSAGWDDSSPFESDATRKHRWTQNNANLGANIITTCVGMGGTQNSTSGTLASMSAGQVTLNKAGWWSITASMYANSGSNRNQGPTLNWAGGGFPGTTTLYQIVGVNGGSGTLGNGLVLMNWNGYASSSAISSPIQFQVFSTVAVTGAVYDLFLEYGGQ